MSMAHHFENRIIVGQKKVKLRSIEEDRESSVKSELDRPAARWRIKVVSRSLVLDEKRGLARGFSRNE